MEDRRRRASDTDGGWGGCEAEAYPWKAGNYNKISAHYAGGGKSDRSKLENPTLEKNKKGGEARKWKRITH